MAVLPFRAGRRSEGRAAGKPAAAPCERLQNNRWVEGRLRATAALPAGAAPWAAGRFLRGTGRVCLPGHRRVSATGRCPDLDDATPGEAADRATAAMARKLPPGDERTRRRRRDSRRAASPKSTLLYPKPS